MDLYETATGLAVIVSPHPLKLAFSLSRLVANPLESPCGDQAQNQEIIAAKTRRVLPRVFVLVGPLEGDVEQGTFVGLLVPDARADGTVTDFVDGLVVCCTGLCLAFHDVFVLLI